MAVSVGIILGLIFGFVIQIHRRSVWQALFASTFIPVVFFVVISGLYLQFQKDPFDVLLGLNRYPTNWEAYGISTEAWGPTEANWGPEENHINTAIGLALSRYFLGYLSLGMTVYGVFLANTGISTKRKEEVENYDENGVLLEKGTLRYGLKHGKWYFFNKNQEVIRTEIWIEGELSERKEVNEI